MQLPLFALEEPPRAAAQPRSVAAHHHEPPLAIDEVAAHATAGADALDLCAAGA